MAIDTQDKRRSVSVAYGWLTVMPVADGTIGTADRPHARWLYRGLTYSAVVAVSTKRLLTLVGVGA